MRSHGSVCAHVYIHTHVHEYINIDIHTHAGTCTHKKYVNTFIRVLTCIHVCEVHTNIRT